MWTGGRLDLLVLGLLVFLCGWHLYPASAAHLHGDEALHYNIAHRATFAESFEVNRQNSHPPLLMAMLSVWSLAGSGELWLRLLPLGAYLLMLWFTWRWSRRVMGEAAGLALTVLLAFLPPLFELATEVRQYTPMLAGAAAGLYYLDRALKENNAKCMAASCAGLCAAILAHFSAVFFLAGYAAYAAWRWWESGRPRESGKWLALCVAVAGLVQGYLAVSQMLELSGSMFARTAREAWLGKQYCTGQGFGCLAGNVADWFVYYFGSRGMALLAAATLLYGCVLLWRDRGQRALFLLVTVPGGSLLLAAALHQYPLGGTRHSIVAAYAALPPVAHVLARLTREDWRRLGAVLLALALIWQTTVRRERRLPEHSREFALAAVGYLQSQVPKGGIVFLDYQASMLFCYYFDPRRYCSDNRGKHFLEYDWGDFKAVVSRTWSHEPNDFVAELKELKAEYKLEKGAEVWVFDAGFGSAIHRMLEVQFAGTKLPGRREFGEHFGVFRVPN